MGSTSKILVTGGAGFIGSNLVDKLLEVGHEVTVIDDLSSGKIRNLRAWGTENRLVFHEGNFADSRFLRSKLPKTDVVIHLAALSSVTYSILHPRRVYKVNAEATNILLKACVENSVARFVFASSAAVYGNRKPPLTEELPPDPLSPYGASKASAEASVRSASTSSGLESVILRFMNVYGPRSLESNEGVIPKFIKAVKKRKPIIVFGDGEQTRDFVHVSDVVDSIISAIGTKSSNADIFNIGTGQPTTISCLVDLLRGSIKSRSLRIRHTKERKGEVRHSFADIGKAARILRFTPKVALREGIEELLTQERLR